MRCTRVEFKGYRRLADTATGIDGDTTAFLGLNESGKSSLLHALEWLSSGGTLAATDRNRSRPPASESSEVVQAFFELDAQDHELVAEVPCDHPPSSVSLSRKVDGGRLYSLSPHPKRPAKPFADARTRLSSARKSLSRQFESASSDCGKDAIGWAVTVSAALEAPDSTWSESAKQALADLGRWCAEVPEGRKTARDRKLGQLLSAVEALVHRPPPAQEIWSLLAARIPEFLLARDEHRQLESVYSLEPTHRALPRAVSSLLRVAAIDPDRLWVLLNREDPSQCEAVLEHGNQRLRELFAAPWNHSGVTVRLEVRDAFLEIVVGDLHDGTLVTLPQRSDALRRFVALAAFLAAVERQVPPVLMIDDAEAHLHHDAQADLVVALRSLDTTQVFYATHSPACLPNDLGTGLRVLRSDPRHREESVIRDDCWTGERGHLFSPQFARLTGAAAFSVCRQAVLVGGVPDVVLLPTLLGLAAQGAHLDYQVAPGTAFPAGLPTDEAAAARVCYLTDGDRAGTELAGRLGAYGVDEARIFALPGGCGVEDLVAPDDYVAVVNRLLADRGRRARFSSDVVGAGKPIAKAFAAWAESNRVQAPGEVEVAYALVRFDGLRLTSAGRKTLTSLHGKFVAAFSEASSGSARDLRAIG